MAKGLCQIVYTKDVKKVLNDTLGIKNDEWTARRQQFSFPSEEQLKQFVLNWGNESKYPGHLKGTPEAYISVLPEDFEYIKDFVLSTFNDPKFLGYLPDSSRQIIYNNTISFFDRARDNAFKSPWWFRVYKTLATDEGNDMKFIKTFAKDVYESMTTSKKDMEHWFGVKFADDNSYAQALEAILTSGGKKTESVRLKLMSGLTAPWLYNLSMTVLNSAGLHALISLNTLGMASELYATAKRSTDFLTGNYSKFRRSLGIGVNISDQLPAWFDTDILSGGFVGYIKYMRKKAVEFNAQGLYNIGEIVFREMRVNNITSNIVSARFPQFNTLEELDVYLKSLPEAERNSLISYINSELETTLRNTTTMGLNRISSSRVIADKNKALQNTYKMIDKAYNFFSGWGIGILQGTIRTIKNNRIGALFKQSMNTKYLDTLYTQGKSEADNYLTNIYLRNDDMLSLIDKITFALLWGHRLDRINDDPDLTDQESILDNVYDAYELGKNFIFPLQGLESTALGREILSMMDAAMLPTDGITDIAGNAAIAGTSRLIKDIFKGFVSTKSAISFFTQLGFNPNDINRATDFSKLSVPFLGKEVDAPALLTLLLNSISETTSGYLYHQKNMIETAGFEKYIPRTGRFLIDSFISYRTDRQKIYDETKTSKTYSLLLDDFSNYFGHWAMYNIPLLKEYSFAQFEDDSFFQSFLSNINGSDIYNQMMDGVLPVMDRDGYVYTYNQLTYYGQVKKDKYLRDFVKDYSFKDDDGNYVYYGAKQRPEELFASLATDAINDNDLTKLGILYENADAAYKKQGVLMLMYANAKTPGAGAELLSNIMYQRYRDIVEERYGKNSDITLSQQNDIKAELGKTYGDYLYITDKAFGWNNVLLYNLRNTIPEAQKYIKDIGDSQSAGLNIVYAGNQYTNAQLNNLFKLHTYSNMMVADGNIDGYAIANAFSDIWNVRKIDAGEEAGELNPAFVEQSLISVNLMVNSIDNMPITDQMKNTMKSGIFIGSERLIKTFAENKQLMFKNEPLFQDTLSFLWGTTESINNLGEELALKSVDKISSGLSGGNQYNSSRYNSGYPDIEKRNSYIYDATRNLARSLTKYKNYDYTQPRSYGQGLLRKSEYSYTKVRGDILGGKFTGKFGAKRADDRRDRGQGSTPKQYAGKARPFTKTEDPDKPIEFGVGGFKRSRRAKGAKVYEGAALRKRLGGSVYSRSYEGGYD